MITKAKVLDIWASSSSVLKLVAHFHVVRLRKRNMQ